MRGSKNLVWVRKRT